MIKYEFAIKIDVHNNGEVIRIPVFRKRSGISRILPGPWNRIVKIYSEYLAMELDFIPKLTEQECAGHIEGYKKVLKEKIPNKICSIELDNLHEANFNN